MYKWSKSAAVDYLAERFILVVAPKTMHIQPDRVLNDKENSAVNYLIERHDYSII